MGTLNASEHETGETTGQTCEKHIQFVCTNRRAFLIYDRREALSIPSSLDTISSEFQACKGGRHTLEVAYTRYSKLRACQGGVIISLGQQTCILCGVNDHWSAKAVLCTASIVQSLAWPTSNLQQQPSLNTKLQACGAKRLYLSSSPPQI